jgi:hypothetical protein
MEAARKRLSISSVSAAAVLLWGLSAEQHAWAQTPLPESTPARTLSCLQKPTEALRFPEKHRYDFAYGLVRVQLRFEHPDQPPKVEVLANTAREDMFELAQDYLRGYRLPCLKATEGAVLAVQEFRFNNRFPESPVPMGAPQPGGSACIVMPSKPPESPQRTLDRDLVHVLVYASFDGDGQQRPQVDLVYSTASGAVESMVKDYLAEYRMPCRTADMRPYKFEQLFTFQPSGTRPPYVLTKVRFGLKEYLGMVKDLSNEVAVHDLNTMACPFSVRIGLRAPALPNTIDEVGPRDANRVLFMKWLASLQVAFSNSRQASDLFDTSVQVDVPCGVVNLGPKAPAATEG